MKAILCPIVIFTWGLKYVISIILMIVSLSGLPQDYEEHFTKHGYTTKLFLSGIKDKVTNDYQ